MILPQLENLVKVDDDITNDNYGHYPDRRPIESLLYYGLVLLDKPAGPTSHEVVAWVKRILEIEKAGHSGTLDPGKIPALVARPGHSNRPVRDELRRNDHGIPETANQNQLRNHLHRQQPKRQR